MKTSDPAFLDLTRTLRQIEADGRSGVLTLDGAWGEAKLYFTKGRLSLLAHPGREPLMERLVDGEAITSADLAATRAARKGTGRALGQVLVDDGVLDEEALHTFASADLAGEAQAIITDATGTQEFQEQKVPRGVFDPEERRLKLALSVDDLALETEVEVRTEEEEPEELQAAAAAEPVTQESARLEQPEEPEEPASIAEVVAEPEPAEYAAHDLLASDEPDPGETESSTDEDERTEGTGRLTPLFAESVAEQRAPTDSALPRPGYESRLPEKIAEGPEPVVLLEQKLTLALDQGRLDDALASARELASIHRELGLHHRAASVYETLLKRAPDHWEARLELAHAQVDCGETAEAVESMSAYGRDCAARRDAEGARRAFAEVLQVDPKNQEAPAALTRLDHGDGDGPAPGQRLQVAGLAVAVICAVLLGLGIMVELGARKALREATHQVDTLDLVEDRRYDEAIATFEAVLEEYPRSLTAIDVEARLAALRAKSD